MDQIANKIIEWMGNRLNNAIMPGTDLAAFGEPLVGYASGDDPLFEFLKEDIGSDFYWTPLAAFKAAYPDIRSLPNELSVIAWVLPQTEHTREANKWKSHDLTRRQIAGYLNLTQDTLLIHHFKGLLCNHNLHNIVFKTSKNLSQTKIPFII
jgi:hypothetical protein